MTDFKNKKHFFCSLDFYLTHLLTVGVMLSSNAFWEEVIFFSLTLSMLKVPPNMLPENILTTMNISGIHIVIVLRLPLPSVWHLSFISKSSQNWRQYLFQKWKLYRRMRTPSWLLSISGVIQILLRVIRLTNGKPCSCYCRLYDFYDMGYFTE